jgi:hypothetical protein
MAKQLQGGLEVFDGHTVKSYCGRLTGTFDIPNDIGIAVGTEDRVTYIVTARVQKSNLVKNTQTGEMTRVNTHAIEDVVALEPDTAIWVLGQIGALVQGVNDGLIEDEADDEDTETTLDPQLLLS